MMEQLAEHASELSSRVRYSLAGHRDKQALTTISEDRESGPRAVAERLEHIEMLLTNFASSLETKGETVVDKQVPQKSQGWNRLRDGSAMDWLALRPGQDEEDAAKGRLALLEDDEFEKDLEELEQMPEEASAAVDGETDGAPEMNGMNFAAVRFASRLRHRGRRHGEHQERTSAGDAGDEGSKKRHRAFSLLPNAIMPGGRKASICTASASSACSPASAPTLAAARSSPAPNVDASASGAKAHAKARRTSFDSLTPGEKDKETEEIPATLEDFVDEVRATCPQHPKISPPVGRAVCLHACSSQMLSKGAIEGRRMQELIAYDLHKGTFRAKFDKFYPLFESGTWQREVLDWILAVTILPTVVMYPLLLGFSHYLHGLLPVLVAFDVIFWLGILAEFATSFVGDEEEIPVKRPGEIAWRYATSWLLPDVISSFPFYLASCAVNEPCTPEGTMASVFPVCVLLCGLRVSKIARSPSARVLLLFAPGGNKTRVSRHSGTFALIRLGFIFLWLSHAAGCLYWYTSILELTEYYERPGRGAVSWEESAWYPPGGYMPYLAPAIPELAASFNQTVETSALVGPVSSYLLALAWGLLHVSGIGVEVPDSPRGVACILVVSLAAIATNATLIGSVTTTLTQINAYRSKEARHRETVTAFLAAEKAPPGLQKRIHEYYDFAGGVSRNYRNIMPGLPKSLHFQLEIFLKRQVFLRVPFFQNCSVKHITALVPHVSSEHMMPGRIIMREGTALNGMYMVARGRVLLVHIESGESRQVGVKFSGGFFCEDALLHNDRVAPWTAMAGDWAELLFLKGSDFLALCVHHPELKQRLLFHEKGKAKGKRATDIMSMHEEKLRLHQQRRGATIARDILQPAVLTRVHSRKAEGHSPSVAAQSGRRAELDA